MRDIKVYYQPIDGKRVDLAIFSKHGRSDLYIDKIDQVIEDEGLCEYSYPVILHAMYKAYCEMDCEVDIHRWMICYAGETRMEWM